MKKGIKYSILAAVIALCSCNPPYSPSDQDIFLEQKDVCMVAGMKEYIGGGGRLIQSSFNPSRHMYRGGDVEQNKDEATGCIVDIVNEYYVLTLDSTPSDAGTKVNGSLYLKHRSLPNSFRTYGTKDKPVEFEVLKAEGGKSWLWASSIKIGVVIKTGAQ